MLWISLGVCLAYTTPIMYSERTEKQREIVQVEQLCSCFQCWLKFMCHLLCYSWLIEYLQILRRPPEQDSLIDFQALLCYLYWPLYQTEFNLSNRYLKQAAAYEQLISVHGQFTVQHPGSDESSGWQSTCKEEFHDELRNNEMGSVFILHFHVFLNKNTGFPSIRVKWLKPS